MLKKMSIRARLTLLIMLLLTISCVGLTIILNFSANQMANVLEATLLTPSTVVSPDGVPVEVPSISTTPALPPSESDGARKDFLYQSILYMVLIVAAGGCLTYYISGKGLKPLQELSTQMKARTVHNLSEHLPIPNSHDEIADLTRSFNEMSGKLDEAFAMQKRFSQSAAHELRTPLTVLKTKVDVFNKRPEHTPQEYHNLLTVITTHTNRLSALVKDLLRLTNMDALDCTETVFLRALLTEVYEDLSYMASEKHISVTIEGEEITIQGNERLLHRAMYNLLENAIKYNKENGSVHIQIRLLKGKTTIFIRDTGIGIPSEFDTLIFEPFYRVDKSRSRQMGGAGLGLSTVKAILMKHHGEIDVSQNPEGGTTFKITL